MTISLNGPESERTTAAGTDYKAKIVTYKFTNQDYIQGLVYDGLIPSADGWRIVARWEANDAPWAYQFFVVKNGNAAVALDESNGLVLDFHAFVGTYNERYKNNIPVSGSGSIKFSASLNLDNGGSIFYMGGIGTGSYSIKALNKGAVPALTFSSLKLTMAGAVYTPSPEGVIETTLTIGKPVIRAQSPTSGTSGSVSIHNTITPESLSIYSGSLQIGGAGSVQTSPAPQINAGTLTLSPNGGALTIDNGVLIVAPTN